MPTSDQPEESQENLSINEEETRHKLEKLRFEARLIQQEADSHASKLKLEKLRTWLTFITGLVGIFGILFTFLSQRHQVNILQVQQTDDNYTKRVELLTVATTEHAKLAALTGLFGYLNKEIENDLFIRTISLLCIVAEEDSSNLIKTFVRDELVRKAPLETLNYLVAQNRELYKETDQDIVIYGDQKTQSYYLDTKEHIVWNVNAIQHCISALRSVENYDLSDVVLGIVSYTHGVKVTASKYVYKGGNIYHHVEKAVSDTFAFTTNSQISNCKFKNTNFQGALLNGMTFKKVHFENCKFDNTMLLKTVFSECTFNEKCSFERIHWYGNEITHPKDGLELNYPTWVNCELKGTKFTPVTGTEHEYFFSDSLLFENTNWKFNAAYNTPNFSIRKSGLAIKH